MSEAQEQAKPIVVGVSPTSGSATALKWAAEEARRRSVPLFAVSAWRAPRPPMTAGARPPIITHDRDDAFAAAEQELKDHVVSILGSDEGVSCRVLEGSPLKVLRKVSRRAALIVIDAPQRNDFSQSPRLAQRLVYRAECPVMVLPPAVTDRPEHILLRGGKKLGANMARAAADAGRPGVRMPRPGQPHGNE